MPRSKSFGARFRARPPLIRYNTGTFTRASVACVDQTDRFAAEVSSNVLRKDGRGLYLFEGARTNLVADSSDPSSWSLSAGVSTRTDNAAPGPDTITSAGRFVSDGTQNYALVRRQDTDTFAAGSRCFSFWYKDEVNTGNHLYSASGAVGGGTGSGGTADGAIPMSGGKWARYTLPVFAVTGTPTFCEYTIYADPNSTSAPGAPVGDSLLFWGAQFEVGAFPSSTILTDGAAVARAADSLTWAAGAWTNAFVNRAWAFVWEPEFASSEAPAAASLFNAGGVAGAFAVEYALSGSQIYVLSGGVTKASKAITFSRNQRMVIGIDPVNGRIHVSGATTGDGSTTGTAWSGVSIAGQTLRVGGRAGASEEAFSYLSEPFAAQM